MTATENYLELDCRRDGKRSRMGSGWLYATGECLRYQTLTLFITRAYVSRQRDAKQGL